MKFKSQNQIQVDRAALAVGMVAHTVVHAVLRSELRSGKFNKTVDTWVEATGAPRDLVHAALDELAKDAQSWDNVGRHSSAFYDKHLALEAVMAVAGPTCDPLDFGPQKVYTQKVETTLRY